MKRALIFTKESDFRAWFEQNLERVGVKRIILSQEVCPDYVAEMSDGRIARIEADCSQSTFGITATVTTRLTTSLLVTPVPTK